MLTVGIKGTLEKTAVSDLSARSMGSGELDVLATPALIAAVEETAWKSIAPYLEEGQGSVGTHLEVSHLAATPLGMKFWCESELVEINGRKLIFSVSAHDETGPIGKGTHERFLVDNASFQKKTDAKAK